MIDARLLIQRVLTAVRDVTENPALELDPSTDFRSQLDLDSLQLLSLATRIERDFEVELPLSALGISTVGEFLKLLERELSSRPERADA